MSTGGLPGEGTYEWWQYKASEARNNARELSLLAAQYEELASKWINIAEMYKLRALAVVVDGE